MNDELVLALEQRAEELLALAATLDHILAHEGVAQTVSEQVRQVFDRAVAQQVRNVAGDLRSIASGHQPADREPAVQLSREDRAFAEWAMVHGTLDVRHHHEHLGLNHEQALVIEVPRWLNRDVAVAAAIMAGAGLLGGVVNVVLHKIAPQRQEDEK